MQSMKVCPKCGVNKPHQDYYVRYVRTGADRKGPKVATIRCRCILCEKEESRIYGLKHKERIRETAKAFRESDRYQELYKTWPSNSKESKRNRYEKNIDKIKQRAKIHAAKPSSRKVQREGAKKRYAEDPKRREYVYQHRLDNIEIYNEREVKRHRNMSDNLSDHYIKMIMLNQGWKSKDFTPGLIELKRAAINAHRMILFAKNGKSLPFKIPTAR